MLVDGRGVPLSLIVTGASVHDSKKLGAGLDAIMVAHEDPPQRRKKHLCADAGCRGVSKRDSIVSRGYIPHVVDRRTEADNMRFHPEQKAHRWVFEASHGWFNRFRKLLVRYEKLERSYVALCHLAAAIIALRKISVLKNIIYG